jgi:hypothetical protein
VVAPEGKVVPRVGWVEWKRATLGSLIEAGGSDGRVKPKGAMAGGCSSVMEAFHFLLPKGFFFFYMSSFIMLRI